MKDVFKIPFGMIASLVSLIYGLSAALKVLIVIMVVDYITGVMVAAIFKNSPKTETGALSSDVGWKGLCKKGMVLLYVLIAYCLDYLIGVNYIVNAVCYCFIANDILSITENAGLMGVYIPPVILSMIDVLKKKSEVETHTEEA